MKRLRRLYYRIFKRYRRLDLQFCTYAAGDILIRATADCPEKEQWVLAIPEEDHNHVFGMVYLERKERITE